jgi:ATP-dependent HslUV protease ATP-binding subunit HslU
LREGKLSQRFVEMELKEAAGPMVEIFAAQGLEELDTNLRDMLSQLMPKKSKRKKVLVPEALEMLTEEEAERLIDMQKVQKTAIDLMENSGIVFIDEIDKIAGREGVGGPDVSREGVQRDLLPLVEGTSVSTKYGVIHTDHILFIAAGAFHTSKPSDLIPEFQGRFPIRVELEALTQADFVRILSETRNALVRQYQALLATEGVTLIFEPSAIEEIAKIASEINENTENIGARRLHTVMEKLLEEVSFAAPEMAGVEVKIDNQYVISKLADIVKDRDLTRYIL